MTSPSPAKRFNWTNLRVRVVSATVVGPAIVEADVAATAAVVLGADALDWLAEQPGLEALLLTDRGEALRTAGWASVAG